MNNQDLSSVFLRTPLATTAKAFVAGVLFFFASAAPPLFADDDHNPIGVTGVFEGAITTGGAYNVLSHNATRQIDDIVVPGAIGKYPLKMTRYYNSRRTYGSLGPGWTHEYTWVWDTYKNSVEYPNGNVWDAGCFGDEGAPLGVSDWWESQTCCPFSADFRLGDGGKVHFDTANGFTHVTTITDPYGLTTTITYDTSGYLTRVTEPGGRYLQFNYSTVNGVTMLTGVDAYDGVAGHARTDWVVYHYTSISPGGQYGPNANCLTSVDYSDSQHATYTYTTDNAPDHPGPPCPCSIKAFPLLSGCNDVRYHGPMRRIAYGYQDQGPHGAILNEKYWDGVAGHEGNGPTVSSISPSLTSPLVADPNFITAFTETRGDGPTRTFNYTALHLHRFSDDSCPTWTSGPAPQQFLLNYTDFKGNSTVLTYDANWYVNSVKDANLYTTSYLRGPPPNAYPGPRGVGQILKITHPVDGTHIDYVYDDETPNISGHYLHSVSDERQKVITYTRDPTTHRVTRIDYPSDVNTPASYEEFTYNSFGQVLTHHLRNLAWESFVYDTRGLLTDKYNPKQTGVPGGTDPHIHYSYYTSGSWTDRVQTMTLPPNFPSNLQATETYEYDRTLGADGTTDPAGAPVAGRGLVTKITHADTPTNTYQSFGYDAYGNKRWEENELRQRSSYTYDDYKRMLTAKNPLNKTATYTYVPTNGGGGSSYKHTTTNPDTVTTPAGIVTSNVYDQNFRKTSTTVAYGTSLAATTTFGYDNVGNLTLITDPRLNKTYNTYDPRNRKLTTTDAYQNALARTTTWHYDAANNIFQIDRPDTTQETKTFDAMNRVLTDTVPKTSNPVVNLTFSFTYNPSGTIQKITDPNLHYTWLYYDASDRKTSMTYHDNSTQGWSYDPAGNLQYRVSVNGTTKYFGYDIRNHLNATSWSNWDDITINPYWCSFAYDAAGRLTEAENGTSGFGTNVISDVHRSYDAAGHLTLDEQIVTGLGTYDVHYPTFDDDSRLTRMYVAGVSSYDFTYSYDAMGRFEKIFLTSGGQLFQYFYDAASNGTERDSIFNGVNQFYPRDALNRIQYMDVKKGTTVLDHQSYAYNSMDRVTSVTYGTGSPDSFTYYLDGELNTATLGNLGHNLTYNLDKMGNRTTVVDSVNGTTTYTPNGVNQYTSVTGTSITNGSEHEISDYQGIHYTYMNDERLTVVGAGRGVSYQLAYDALGRCVRRTLNGAQSSVTTYYIYDGDKPILEYDASAASVGTNVCGKGIDEVLERVAIGSDGQLYVYYPHQNHEGSVTLLTDTGGNVIERYRYDAFGAPTVYDQSWNTRAATIYNNRFLFTGREYSSLGFYEYRARAYHPGLGRFMSEDPKLFDAGDYNLFRYCHNDPIDFTDPTGLYAFWDDLFLAGSGAVIGLGGQGLEDLMSGHYSGWQAYTGAAVGGAVGLWSAEYVGPVVAGAGGSALANSITQELRIASGAQHGFNGRELAAQTAIGGVASKLPGFALGRFNQGRNSYSAIAKQMQTKLANGTVSNVTAKTAAKMVAGNVAHESGSTAAEAAANAAAHASQSGGSESNNTGQVPAMQMEFRAGMSFNPDGTRTVTFPNQPQELRSQDPPPALPPVESH